MEIGLRALKAELSRKMNCISRYSSVSKNISYKRFKKPSDSDKLVVELVVEKLLNDVIEEDTQKILHNIVSTDCHVEDGTSKRAGPSEEGERLCCIGNFDTAFLDAPTFLVQISRSRRPRKEIDYSQQMVRNRLRPVSSL